MARLRDMAGYWVVFGGAVLAFARAFPVEVSLPPTIAPPQVQSVTMIEAVGGRLDWSPDGTRLAYDRPGADGYYDLWLMNPDGTGKTPLTEGKIGLPGRHMGQPAFHPGGKWIVFQAEKRFHSGTSESASPGLGKHNDLWVIRTDGTVYHRLTNLGPNLATLHPHFSHDGTKLLWGESTNALSGWVLKLADVVVTPTRVYLGAVQTLQPGPPPAPAFAFYETHGFSPDDTQVLFAANLASGQHWTGMDIYRYDIADGTLERLTDTVVDWDEHARTRPDGEWVVWMSSTGFSFDPQTQVGLRTEYWIMRADGTQKTRLTGFNVPGSPTYTGRPVVCADAAWSPDGTKLAGLLIDDGFDLGRIVVLDFGGDADGAVIGPVIGDTPGETVIIEAGQTVTQSGTVLVVRDGRLVVRGTLDLTGHLVVTGNATVRVDGGQFHLRGDDTHILVNSSGTFEVINQSLFHYEQTYVAQHVLACTNNSRVEIRDSTVSCDGSTETIRVEDRASYEALNVYAPDWKTWYVSDRASLSLEHMYLGGDVVFYDSPTFRFVDTTGVMPWLHFADGTVVDFSFPEPDAPGDPVSLTLDATTPGVTGIPWSLTIEDCRYVAWGLNPYSGSDVTIRNSRLTMLMFRFLGNGAQHLQGILQNRSTYADTTIPVQDRHLRLVNTFVEWWKVDVHDQFRLSADDLVFSEMMVKHQARAHVTNSICEGQTIHVGVQNDAQLLFEDGQVWTYVSAWDNALMVLNESLVDYRKGEYTYQTRNIAHGRSRLYALNTTFGFEADPAESEPEAFDSALAMVARIDGPVKGSIGAPIPVAGAAWIAAGPRSPVRFARYVLSLSPAGADTWYPFASGTDPVKAGIIGVLPARAVTAGSYDLRLTVWVNGDEVSSAPTYLFPAEGVLTVVE